MARKRLRRRRLAAFRWAGGCKKSINDGVTPDHDSQEFPEKQRAAHQGCCRKYHEDHACGDLSGIEQSCTTEECERCCLSSRAAYPTGTSEGTTELLWGDLHDLHRWYREKEQLRETVATVELLLDGQVIVDQQLYSSTVVGIDNSRVY